jgi:hypothetical protein
MHNRAGLNPAKVRHYFSGLEGSTAYSQTAYRSDFPAFSCKSFMLLTMSWEDTPIQEGDWYLSIRQLDYPIH